MNGKNVFCFFLIEFQKTSKICASNRPKYPLKHQIRSKNFYDS